MKKVLAEELKRLKPDPKEAKKVMAEVNDFLKKLNKRLSKAKAVLGGSFAKDTWLTGDYDVDIFVRFVLSEADKDISAMLEKALKPFKAEKLHGSRDYFQIKNKIHYEIIPVLAITKASQAKNVTDCSYSHVKFTAKQSKKIKDDIRLFKQFCKAQKIYGAESYVKGFSGHVVDLLVIKYKGFLPLLRDILKWKPKKVIDMKNYHKGKALMMLNKSKTQGPLVFVDTVQPERNAAAALSIESLEKLQKAAKEFLKKPSLKYFEVQPFKPKKGHLITVKGNAVKGTVDVSGTKLLKVHERMLKALQEYGTIQSDWVWDNHTGKAEFYYVVKEKRLPKTFEHKGPPLKMKKAVERFKKANKKTFTRKGHVWTKKTRTATTPEEAIKQVLKSEKDRILRARI